VSQPPSSLANERMEEVALFLWEKGGAAMLVFDTAKKYDYAPFGYLHLNDPLHPYFLYLLRRLESGHGLVFQQKRDMQSASWFGGQT
jgi:hypothetical protein